MPVTTGYEKVVAHRTSDLFATTAKLKGKVIAKNSYSIVVEFEDGSVKSVELGRRYGKAAGATIPHDVITDLSEGDTVDPGRVIAWDQKHFEKDILDPLSVRWKVGKMVKVALVDGADTFEDSDAISERVAKDLGTETTYVRNLVINFDQRIVGLVKEGQHIEPDGILCTIQDSVTTGTGLFDDAVTIQTLQMLSDATPKAKHRGTVEKIEVVYNGEIEEMDESLQAIAMYSDRRLSKVSSALGKPKLTGKVDGAYRVEGKKLQKNQVAILVHITSNIKAGVGDKFVFGHQLKSITCRVMTGINRTESGIDLDALFGWQSVANRIVNSPVDLGTACTVLIEGGKMAVKIYEELTDE